MTSHIDVNKNMLYSGLILSRREAIAVGDSEFKKKSTSEWKQFIVLLCKIHKLRIHIEFENDRYETDSSNTNKRHFEIELIMEYFSTSILTYNYML